MQSDFPVRYAAERLALRLLWISLLVLFLLLGVPQLWRLFSPFLIAIPVAAVLQPPIRFLQERLHLRRGFAVTLLVLLVCSVAFILLYWFVSFVVVQIMNAANNAPSIISSVIGVLQAAANRLLNAAQSMPASVGEAIRTSLDSVFSSINRVGMTVATSLVNLVFTFAAGVPYIFVYTNFLVLGIFFLTGRYGSLSAFWQKSKQAPSRGQEAEAAMDSGESISLLRQSAIRGMVGYVRVQFLFFMLTFFLSWVYFQFLGFEYAMLIGIIAALLELIPQFGCGTLYIPWSAISFIIGANQNGWLILGLYLAYSLLRRLAEPKILGDNLGVSPLLSLIGMFVGMQIAGIVGLIAGPIVMVILTSAIRAHLFDGILADIRTVSRYMKARWKRGKENGGASLP